MKIEVLFPEICNLYGDLFNVKYLSDCLQEAEVVNTGLKDEPLFVTEEPSLIYMGTTTERGQQLVIEALTPYKERIKECIDKGVCFFVTGNAMEVFGKTISEEGAKVCDGLGILDIDSDRNSRVRYNSLYLGEFKDESLEEPIKIAGFKSLFGFAEGDNREKYFLKTLRGDGLNLNVKEEGIRINNFFATYVTGPFLVLNPPFTRWLMRNVMGVQNAELAFEEAAMDAYMSRIKEYSDPSTGIKYE